MKMIEHNHFICHLWFGALCGGVLFIEYFLEKFRLVQIDQVWLFFYCGAIGFFCTVLDSRHNADAVSLAERLEFRCDLFGIDFYVRWAVYRHPILQAGDVIRIYFDFHFRSKADKLFQHSFIGEPEETVRGESFQLAGKL